MWCENYLPKFSSFLNKNCLWGNCYITTLLIFFNDTSKIDDLSKDATLSLLTWSLLGSSLADIFSGVILRIKIQLKHSVKRKWYNYFTQPKGNTLATKNTQSLLHHLYVSKIPFKIKFYICVFWLISSTLVSKSYEGYKKKCEQILEISKTI